MNKCIVCAGPFETVDWRAKFCSRRCRAYGRPFRMWDGEGRSVNGKHQMILLACTDGNVRQEIRNETGLSTDAVLQFLTEARPKAINCWFAFGYDVNKILNDLPLRREKRSLKELWTLGHTYWHGKNIQYTPRKIFQVSHKGRVTFHSYDTFGFFQKAFLKVCKDFEIDTALFEEGKNARGKDMESWSLDKISEYNFYEMEAMLAIMGKLRAALYEADLLPAQWHGPGAIASKWLTKYKVDQWYKPPPETMIVPISHAYFGGRIDISCVGAPFVFRNDIASAYPAGLAECLSLADVEWVAAQPTIDDKHGLYHVRWNIVMPSQWGPFPWRTPKGNVLFPLTGEGWYWGIEVFAAEKIFGSTIQRIEAWYPKGVTPFGEKKYPLERLITQDYDKRQELKDAGNPAELGIKLALNSLYGKMAQHHARYGVPRWRNYIWAGWTTAYCRARILEAIREVGQENVVAIATDGIFTRVPLTDSHDKQFWKSQGRVGPPLGAWTYEGSGKALIVAPGLYALYTGNEPTVYKSRGMPEALNFGYILRSWGCTTTLNTPGANAFKSRRAAFVGMGVALHRNVAIKQDGWATFLPHGEFVEQERMIRDVTIFGTSKRIPPPEWLGVEGWQEFPLAIRPRSKDMPLLSTLYLYRAELDDTVTAE